MKHSLRFTVLLLLLSAPVLTSAQRTMKDYVSGSCDVVWLGLDFSKARIVGSTWRDDTKKIKHESIPAWNDLTNESGRFNWKKAFQNEKLIIDYGPVTKANATIDESTLMVAVPYTIGKDDIRAAVAALDMDGRTDGIGVVIVIEAFDQSRATGYGYIAFFDIGGRELLHSQSVSGGGFGVTLFTYWAKAIVGMRDLVASRVLRDVRKRYG